MKRLLTGAKRRGQAIIEFAVILPLILLLIGGVIDFGIFMFEREQAASCVRTIARKASVRSATAMSISASPQCERASSQNGLTLTPGDPAYKTALSGTNVTAAIEYDYDPIFLDMAIPGWNSIDVLQVKAQVTMRMEAGQAT